MDSSHLQTLSQWSPSDVYIFLHRILDGYIDQADFEQAKTAIVANSEVKRIQESSGLSCEDFLHLIDSCLDLFFKLVSNSIQTDDLDELLGEGDKVKSVLLECFQLREKELFKAIIFKSITARHSYLENFDWKVSVVVSHDQMRRVCIPIVKLSLAVHEPNSHVPRLSGLDSSNEKVLFESQSNATFTRVVSFEFTETELEAFIKKLEEARKALYKQIS